VVGVIARLARFIAGSYPPVALLDAAAWALGETALFAALDHRGTGWRPGPGIIIAAVTLAVAMLMMRALDDIRDLDYDRRRNPGRPLASGAVRVSDLLVLCVACGAALIALNAGDVPAQVILAIQFGYAAVVMAVDHAWHWPPGDNLLAGLAVSFPAPVLLQVYLYARFLDAGHLRPAGSGALAILIVTLARFHAEFARKVVRQPSASERTYVHNFGLAGTIAAAAGAAVGSTVLLLGLAPEPWALLGLVPLWWALRPAGQVGRGTSRRWPRWAPVLFMLSSFAVYLVIGLAS
jgi:hypothetical protein